MCIINGRIRQILHYLAYINMSRVHVSTNHNKGDMSGKGEGKGGIFQNCMIFI